MRLLILCILGLGLIACGAERLETSEQSSASTSSVASTSTSNTSSSLPNSKEPYLPCSFCDKDELIGSLTVISQSHYQTKLAELLDVKVNEHGNDGYSHRVERYTGRTIFAGDELAQRRITLAIQTFYDAAVLIASRNKAIDCQNFSALDCADLFISEFVAPLYERPLTDMEVEDYRTTFTLAQSMGEDGQKHGIIAALSSPHFLFRKLAQNETKDNQETTENKETMHE